jgi:hypothetical protein
VGPSLDEHGVIEGLRSDRKMADEIAGSAAEVKLPTKGLMEINAHAVVGEGKATVINMISPAATKSTAAVAEVPSGS